MTIAVIIALLIESALTNFGGLDLTRYERASLFLLIFLCMAEIIKNNRSS